MADPTPPTESASHQTVGDTLRELFRPPERSSAVWTLIGAFLAAAVCWFFGADVWHSLLIGACVGAAGLAVLAIPPDHRLVQWQGTEADRDGARPDVVRLSWSLRPSWGRVRGSAQQRVRDLARRRLAARQLDLRDPAHGPAIAQLIGSSAYAVVQTDLDHPPRLRAVLHCLDVLDALDTTPAATRSTLPATTGLLRRIRRAR